MKAWQKKVYTCRQSLRKQHFYFFYPFSSFQAIFVINHAKVSFHKSCAPCVNILDKLVLGSFKHITHNVHVGQNPVNHLHIHHTIPHIFVEPSQPFSTTSAPRCFKRFPSSQKENNRTKHLHMLVWLPGDQQYDRHTCLRVAEVHISELQRWVQTGAELRFLW